MKKSIIYLLGLYVALTGYTENSNDSPSRPDIPATPDTTTVAMMVSSFIRPNFYSRGRISIASMLHCTDLIVQAVTVNTDGTLSVTPIESYDGAGVKDLQALITALNSALTGNKQTLRLGISSSTEWKEVIADSTKRITFATAVKTMLTTYDLSGVDLDFEWAYNATQFQEYNLLLLELRQTLGTAYCISVQAHPLYYKLLPASVTAVDYIFLQCYGPQPDRFPYSVFTENIQTVINYGIPADKLVAGVPFYGVATDGSGQTVAYYTLVEEGLVTSTAQDSATYNSVEYLYNGADVIAQKTAYAHTTSLAGMMSWDLATDVAYTDTLSLLRAMVLEIESW